MILGTKDRKIQGMVFVFGGLITPLVIASQTKDFSPPATYSIQTKSELTKQETFISKFSLRNAHIPIQLGIYFSSQQGKSQDINIQGLVGDYFSYNTSGNHSQNGLFGVGYYVDGLDTNRYVLLYGINAYYFAPVSVNGTITQEQLFTNLSYRYSISDYPIFIATKVLVKNDSNQYNITLDLGIGPNIIHTSHYREASLDGGITIPDRAFSGKTNTVFSATAGIGIRINNLFAKAPLECGYRFFYLGQGRFNRLSDQLITNLKTGNNFANAVICSVTV